MLEIQHQVVHKRYDAMKGFTMVLALWDENTSPEHSSFQIP